MSKITELKEMYLFNVIFEDHSQSFVCASSFGKAATAAYCINDSGILAITKSKSVNVLF